MLLLLAVTGLRVGELVGLSIADVDRVAHTLRVRGNGSRYRNIWWNVEPLQGELQAYLEWRQTQNTAETALFRHERRGPPHRSLRGTVAEGPGKG